MRTGDEVRVYPHGKPEQVAIGKVMILSSNRKSIAVGFPDKPPFVILTDGIMVHPDFGIVLMASRYDIGPWIETFGGGHYEIEEST